jgi:hypothetical protein
VNPSQILVDHFDGTLHIPVTSMGLPFIVVG